jgi:hypothetical protein
VIQPAESRTAAAKEETMTSTRSESTVHAQLVRIGVEIVPVYGDNRTGWSFEPGIQSTRWPIYRTIDELFFALVNMNISPEGNA